MREQDSTMHKTSLFAIIRTSTITMGNSLQGFKHIEEQKNKFYFVETWLKDQYLKHIEIFKKKKTDYHKNQ